MQKIEQYRLKNGIKVVVVPMKGFSGVMVEVLVKIGSKYEVKGEFGMSHFLEHMAFKGTKKRPRSEDVAREIDAKGAECGAGTEVEVTSYSVTTIRQNLDWAMELLVDILVNSTYKSEEMTKERGVIIEEIRMYEDTPLMGLVSDFAQFVFGKPEVGCFNISGEVEDVSSIDRKGLVDYKKRYLDSSRMVVTVTGDVGDGVFDRVREYFDVFETGGSRDLPKVNIKMNDERVLVKKKEAQQGHFCVGVPGLAWADKRKYALRLLEVVLAGCRSSRLFREIREKRGWAYYVFGVGQKYREAGFVAVQAGVKMDRLDEAIDLTVDEMMKMGDSLKTKEVGMAKEYVLGKMKLAMDQKGFWSGFVGRKMLLEGKLASVEEEMENYRKVNRKMMMDLAKELFVRDKVRRVIVRKG